MATYHITEREAEIIRLMLSGRTNRDIAMNLGIAERTVKTHITNIHGKLKITGKLQMVELLRKYDLIPTEPLKESVS